MSHNRFPLWVILAIVLLILGTVFYQSLEWIETEHDLGFSNKARQQPFLAAEQFLQTQDIGFASVNHFRTFDEPDLASTIPVDDTIMLMDAYGSLSDRRAEALLTWVAGGGHLMVSTDNPYLKDIDHVRDPVFDLFSVERIRGYDDFDYDQLETLDTLDDLTGMNLINHCDVLYAQDTFSFADDDHQVEADFITNDSLDGDSDVFGLIGEPGQYHMLQYQYGDGMISYLVSFKFWQNKTIGCLDHAYILAQLAPTSGNTLHVYYNHDYPNLFVILWRHFYAVVIAAVILLMLWLWSRMMRFGPVRREDNHGQRQILEHIRASAGFLWRMDKGESLIQQTRAEVRGLLRQRIQHIDRLSEAEQIRQLSQQLRITKDAVAVALFQPAPKDHAGFTHTIRALQHIKDKL
ncbi:DUF4350 domain-containing protein [Gynuella sp.]|uniref:DUF4350 domain-containing protein n=1 Tax=Gynuella sp. TaxID=2969146 RepID=UPI003D14C37E